MGGKKHATTTTAVAAAADPKNTNSTTGLPELPVVGNQPKWDVAKIVLRSLSLFTAFVITCFVIGFNFAGSRYVTANTSFGISIATLCWDAAEFIVVCARRSRARGIKPAAHVGVDLVLWLGAVTTLALQSVFIEYRTGYFYEIQDGGEDDAYGPWFAVDITHLVMLGVLALLHFILFVRACVEVDRRKKDRRVQALILAMQKQGQNPQDYPLSTFTTFTLPPSHPLTHSPFIPQLSPSSSTVVPPPRSSAGGERDFSLKYNHALAPPVPELHDARPPARSELPAAPTNTSEVPAAAADFDVGFDPDEMEISPEELRNQKVLIGAFPR
ncbi:hypothetical protein F4810DRAFT_440499 [Camillea tinctor]|nr:hypothetical protein F4810DRAFT_440499 [Camillea tinctor]